MPPVASVSETLPPLRLALRGPCTCRPCLPPGVLLRALKAFTSGTRYRLFPAAMTVPAHNTLMVSGELDLSHSNDKVL